MMRKRRFRGVAIVLITAALALGSTLAFAQGGATTATLSGVVADTSGAVVPGADVTVKDNARGTVYAAVTGSNGAFTIPSLLPGTYTLTVALAGFKTAVLSNVVMNAGVSNAVKVLLEVGALEETVTVAAQTEIVQTQSAAVTQTLNTQQISTLPLTTRAVMDFVANLPGVNTASDVRSGTISGLPNSAVNITLDGMNVQDNFLKSSDGMFALVGPRIDAVEEMTVSSAASSAESIGQGAIQIRFTTRSGSNDWRGSAYLYYRDTTLNAMSWFNVRDHLQKAAFMQRQPGARMGGPIIKDKLFFFVNYEESRNPSQVTRNRTILSPDAMAGNYLFLDAAGNVQKVNLLNVNGNVSTPDPTIAKLMADIRAATQSTGTIIAKTDPMYQGYTYQVMVNTINRFPTTRLDYNITSKHRLSGVVNYQKYYTDRDTTNQFEGQFPGFPVFDGQQSKRYAYSMTLRSVLSSNMVNEARYGGAGSPVYFWPNVTPAMWSGPVANQGGFALRFSTALSSLTNPDARNGNAGGGNSQARNAYDKVFEDTLSWMKGSHSLTFGFSFSRFDAWMTDSYAVPSISFGIVNDPGGAGVDPANNFLIASNFPAGADLAAIKGEYALLMGHVSQIGGVARMDASGNYQYQGQLVQKMRMDTFGGYASDAWRMKPNLTLSAGLRYEVLLPFKPLNNSYSTPTIDSIFGVTGPGSDFVPGALVTNLGNLFKPGTLQGVPCQTTPTVSYSCFYPYTSGTSAYATDWNNLAPSVGFNWSPSVEKSFLHKLLGDQPVIRGGFSVAYTRNGLGDFSGEYSYNPGGSISATRSTGNANLGTVPVLLSQPSTLGPPSYPSKPIYPLTTTKTSEADMFDPNIQVPYSQTYSFGLQRVLTKTLAVEARYVGTRSRAGWTALNYNEIDIQNNHFLDEFKLAQANLQANIAAGKGNTFAYTGAPGTSPLPIYLAYFQGLGTAAATNPANYTNSNFKSSTYYNALAVRNPQPFTAAGTGSSGLNGSQTFIDNAVKAGLPPNFFMVNPDLRGGLYIESNGGYTKYDSLQMELRYRPARALRFDANYTWGQQWGSTRYSFKVDRLPTLSTGGSGGITHAIRANWVYELPFGQGRRFGGGVGRSMNMLVGGWNVNGIVRIQSGRLIDLGNVRLVNMTQADVQNLFQLQIDPQTQRVWMFPQDIRDNTVRAFSVNATSATGYGTQGPPTGRYFAPANGPDCIEQIANGYGQCGVRSLVVTGPLFARLDLSLAKRISVTKSVSVELMAQIVNVLNRVNFTPVGGIGSNPDSFEVTGADAARTTQLSFRINW